MVRDSVAVRVPASTANLGPGFDSLGMALNLYLYLEMKRAERTLVSSSDEELKNLPAGKDNLLYEAAKLVFDHYGQPCPELEIRLCSEIPLTRGLGSSATAIIAGMSAAHALLGEPLDSDVIFQLATQMEQHPDNVGASLFGGIIASVWDGQRADYVRIEPPASLGLIAVIPDFHLETKKAREVLPKSVSFQDAVFNVSRSSLLVAAIAEGRLDKLGAAMQDRLHQPFRSALVPGMETILQEGTKHGALGVTLSGAGPTMLAFVDVDQGTGENIKMFMQSTLDEREIPCHILDVKPCTAGVIQLTLEQFNSTFNDNSRHRFRNEKELKK